ncbi:MAG: ComEC/Rec2 family competence protein, partial [Candidatus Methylomirabilia bacterium]
DAGPRWRDYDAGERIVVPALRRLGLTDLETLAISHPHPDHDGGVAAVRRELGVGRTWGGEGALAPVRGNEFALAAGVRVRILNPGSAGTGAAEKGAAANDRSLALSLSFEDTCLVLTGDAGPAQAADLAAAAKPLPSHVALVAPHHGGSPEACRLLSEAIRPEVSVISVGRNTYGHPRAAAVAALGNTGRVLRTDRAGAIFLRSDGQRWEVRTWRELSSGRTWAERVRWLVAGW